MRKVAGLIGAVVMLSGCVAGAPNRYADDPGALGGVGLRQALRTEGQLWLLDNDGDFVSLPDNGADTIPQPSTMPVLDMCLYAGTPVLVTRAPKKSWALKRYTDGMWSTFVTVASDGDGLKAMACDTRHVALLTDKRLIIIDEAGTRSAPLIFNPLPPASAWRDKLFSDATGNPRLRYEPKFYADSVVKAKWIGDAIYAGLDMGEWGGGILRINPLTAHADTIEDAKEIEEICVVPFDRNCDPIADFAQIPWEPDCVVAAKRSRRGALLRICGDRISLFHTTPDISRLKVDSSFDYPETERFFSVVTRGDSLWAAGYNNLYHFRKDQPPEVFPLKFESIGNLRIDRSHPDVIAVGLWQEGADYAPTRETILVPR